MELQSFRGTLSLLGPELAGHIQRLSPNSEVEVNLCFLFLPIIHWC